MRYKEIAQPLKEADEQPLGYYEPEDDKFLSHMQSDVSKPKVTLRIINKLKKVRATKKYEINQKQELLGKMYGAPADDGGL